MSTIVFGAPPAKFKKPAKKKKEKKPAILGYVLYNGPSQIDGSPIVVIGTLKSGNKKTGNMIQTWILSAGQDPIETVAQGLDGAICGNCPLRGFYLDGQWVGRSCYVRYEVAPLAVYRTWKEGKYLPISDISAREKLHGRYLRFGSYGDPCAVPIGVWESLKKLCNGRVKTGYTHQWRNSRFQEYKKFLMASTHSGAESAIAHKMGWRTFETVSDCQQLDDSKIVCPYTVKDITCSDCGLCDGANGKKNVQISAHGPKHKMLIMNTIARISLHIV